MTAQRNQGRFRSRYTDDARLLVIKLVTTEIRANDPRSVSQSEFDANATEIIARLQPDWPEPPTARALWMKLTKGEAQPKRSWRQLIEAAIGSRSIPHTAGAGTREKPLPDWFEEPHVVYAVRRIHLQVGRPATLTIDQYEHGRAELLASVRGDRREQLVLLLPSGHQLAELADGDWNVILALAGLPPVIQGSEAGHPIALIAWHYYETQNHRPAYRKLRRYASGLGLALVTEPSPWSSVHEEVARLRSVRGWTTPDSGPDQGQRLDDAELAALLEGAPASRHTRGYWTPQRILDGLIEYIKAYEGIAPLRQKHYMGVRAGRDWPTWNAIRTVLVPGRDDVRWDEALAIATRERRRRQQAA